MQLCVAEKPSVAREIAAIIGATTRRDGYLEGNGYCVSWTFGHLCTLKDPHDYLHNLKMWRLCDLPIIPQKFGIKLIDNEGSIKQFNTIKKLIEREDCKAIINCGDAGQEGELIQQWVYHKAGNTKPIKRLWISSLTEEAIKEGFKQLKDNAAYTNLFQAGSARAYSDWLLGINASRLYTIKYGEGKQVLSIGRVQTPTLAMIVKRYYEILHFEEQDYWEIKTVYRGQAFLYEEGKFTDKSKAEGVLTEIQALPLSITKVEKKKGKEYAPRLFDLTSLQVEANKKLSFSADKTLQTVQSLYEKKMVSYPRVDTTYLPEDMHPKIAGILQKLNDFSTFTAAILEKKIPKNKRVFDNKKITDHHAIIPTGVNNSSLSPDEQEIYDLIARRFVANFMPVCEVSNTRVEAKVGKYLFKATGKEIIKEGWRALYASSDKNAKGNEHIMPTFSKGESGEHQAALDTKRTRPPKSYTEATLLRAMETAGKQVEDESLREQLKANGIGRPSTRANIIETLFRRRYIERKGKSIHPTAIGIALIGRIRNNSLKSAELTGQWELKLNQIAQGAYSMQAFLDELKALLVQIVMQTRQKETPATEIRCPKCKKGHLIKGKTAYGCSEWKKGCEFTIPFKIIELEYQNRQISTDITAFFWQKFQSET